MREIESLDDRLVDLLRWVSLTSGVSVLRLYIGVIVAQGKESMQLSPLLPPQNVRALSINAYHGAQRLVRI